YSVITVKKDETADSIARKYNTTVRAIFKHNNPQFFEGERLIIETEYGFRYIVMPFDTLESIAKKHNISTECLAQNNQISKVFLGQTIIIPIEVNYKKD
ncbi:MAG: LysM peptidoglycan-binding domain-containing protein, partial [Clostridia bacterium]